MNIITDFLKNLIDINPGSQFKFYIPMIILGAVLIIGAIAFGIVYKKRKNHDFAFKKLFKKTSGRLFWLGSLILLLTLIRYENIPYFSMRLLLYLSLILIAYSVYRMAYVYKMIYPKERENVMAKMHKAKEENSKYLPSKKRK